MNVESIADIISRGTCRPSIPHWWNKCWSKWFLISPLNNYISHPPPPATKRQSVGRHFMTMQIACFSLKISSRLSIWMILALNNQGSKIIFFLQFSTPSTSTSWRWVFYSSIWTSFIKYYRLGGFKKRNVYFHSSWRLEVHGQGAGRVGFRQGLFFFSLAKGHLLMVSPHGLFTMWMHLWWLSSYKNISPIGLGLTLRTSLNLNYCLKDTVCIYSHIFGVRASIFKDAIQYQYPTVKAVTPFHAFIYISAY